uniref:Uncharacterized protein n=1 Tax=Octactis speculum TaxID=3111310 RepID=A0A6U3X0P0_9STRA|mmetsp:Transcript_5391/g.6686  ORF Transcript_5391/g.6686 Transcript_5391/m.6686 type:complete len:682 (+) Transcript_5391:173-2218(+)
MASSPADGNQMDGNNDALRVAMATSQRLSLEKDRDDNHKNVYKKKVEEFETWLVFNGQDFQMKITKIQMNQDGSVLLTGHITGYFSVKSEAFMEIMTDFDDSFKIASHDFEFESCNEQECETSCDSSRLLNPDGSALDGFSVDNVVIGSFLRFLGPTLNSVRLRYKTPRDRNTPTYDEISQEYVFTYLLRRSCLNHKGQTCQLGEEALKTHQSALKDRWRTEYEAATGSRRQQLQTHDPRQATKRVIAMYLNRRRGSDEAIGAALVRFLAEEERGIPGSALREIASFSFFSKGLSGNVPSRDIEKEWLFRTVILFMVQASVRCFNAAFMCVMGQKIQELSKRESDLSLAQGVRFSLHNDKPTQRKFEKNALIIPHESVNLCALWSLAVLMYMRDMKGAFTKVDFTCGVYAARYKLFPGTKGPMSPMCPATFRTWFKQFLVMAGVSICFHITHLARQSMNYFNANAGSPLDEAALNMHGNYSSKQNDREKGYTSPYSEDAALFLSSLAATADKAPDTPIARGGSPFVRLWLLTPQVPPLQVLSKVYATERAYLEEIKGGLGVPGCRPASSETTKLIDDRRAMLDYYSIVLVNGLCSELDELPIGHFIRTWPLIYQPEFLQYRKKFLETRTAAVDQIEQRRISQTPLNQGDVPVLGRTIATTMVPIIMDAMNRKWGSAGHFLS